MKQKLLFLFLIGSLTLSLSACSDGASGALDELHARDLLDAMSGFLNLVFSSDSSSSNVHMISQEDSSKLERSSSANNADNLQNAGASDTQTQTQTNSDSSDGLTMLDGTPFTQDYYFYRAALDETSAQAYDQIYQGLLEGQREIDLSSLSIPVDEISNLYYSVLNDHPELFWLDSSLSYHYYDNYSHNGHPDIVTNIEPVYNRLAEDIPGYTARIQDSIQDALYQAINLDKPLDRVKLIHDYLAHTIDYDAEAVYNQNLYSALVEHRTVCAGYAHAFQYCMMQLGIPTAYVTGEAVSDGVREEHAWNLVELDGQFFNIDVTWDDPVGKDPNVDCYDYFNLTDQELSADHTRDALSLRLPAANGTQITPQITTQITPQTTSGGDVIPDSGWWNALDETWSREDWAYDNALGCWTIFDVESQILYGYDEAEETFLYVQPDSLNVYVLDDAGNWTPLGLD